ncbi:hypothetical protein L9F63_018439, partial [Diploptera punctata]
MRKNTRYQDIYSSVSLMLCLSKILGLAPYSCSSGKSTKWDVMYSLLIVFVLTTWCVSSLAWKINHDYPKLSYTIMVPDALETLISNVSLISAVSLFAICHRHKFQQIFHKITIVDEMLLGHLSHKIYRKMKIISIIEMLIWFLICLIIFWFDQAIWAFDGSFIYYIKEYIFHMIGNMFFLQFTNLVLLLRHRYALLNKKLESLFGEQVTSLIFHIPLQKNLCSRQLRDKTSKIIELQTLHLSLFDAANLINSCYGMSLLSELTFLFVALIQNIYYTLVIILQFDSLNIKTSVGETVSILICWIILRLLKMVCIATSCQMASEEANRTGRLVRNLLLRDYANTNCLEKFSHQLLHYRLQFSASGFFTLDYTYLYSVAGAITTYLIILLQFN